MWSQKKQLSNVEIDYIKEHEAKGWTPDVLCNHDSSLFTVSVKTLYRRYKEDERLCKKFAHERCENPITTWKTG